MRLPPEMIAQAASVVYSRVVSKQSKAPEATSLGVENGFFEVKNVKFLDSPLRDLLLG